MQLNLRKTFGFDCNANDGFLGVGTVGVPSPNRVISCSPLKPHPLPPLRADHQFALIQKSAYARIFIKKTNAFTLLQR